MPLLWYVHLIRTQTQIWKHSESSYKMMMMIMYLPSLPAFIYVLTRVAKFTQKIILIIVWFMLVSQQHSLSTQCFGLGLRSGCSMCCLQSNTKFFAFNNLKFADTMFANKTRWNIPQFSGLVWRPCSHILISPCAPCASHGIPPQRKENIF